MDEWIKVVILGIVQGISEFLPISSTGHLIVTAELLNFNSGLDGTFTIFIQIGSVLAVLVYYRKDLFRQVVTIPSSESSRKLWLGVIVASIPAAVLGFTLRDQIKTVLYSPVTVGIMLILGGIIFIVSERKKQIQERSEREANVEDVTLRQAVLVGLAQSIALIPGVSRSGASILGGLWSGLDRPTAAAFSFYLAIPVLGGATIIDLLLSLDQINAQELGFLIVGALVSAVVSFIAIGWLLRFVSRNTFTGFGYYRIGAGIVILALVALDIVH